jgi:hypothetical protein
MKKQVSYFLVVSLTLSALACGNTYSALANKTSDDAIYENVQQLADEKDWAAALTAINTLSAGKKSDPAVIETWAGLLAGQCGLDFISYFNTVSTGSLAGSTPLKFLMNAFTQVAVNPGSCQLAQAKMEEISTNPANRTQSENIFMAILGMVKIGTYLRADADKDGSGNLGDGSADTGAGYDSCSSLSIPDADVTQVITGIGLVSNNSAALSAVVPASAIGTAMASISAACGATCSKTDSTTVTGADITLVRDILKTGVSTADPTYQLGIDDTCNPSDLASLLACCP